MDARELVRKEIDRMLDGGNFDESFWQKLYNPSRNDMYEAQRLRDGEVYTLRAIAATAADQAKVGGTVEKRAARKAAEKVRKAEGVLRARKNRVLDDPINLAWRNSVQWIADARDACVYIARSNAAMKSPDAVLYYEPPKPIVYEDVPSKKKGRSNVAA